MKGTTCEHFTYSPEPAADCLPTSSSDIRQLPLLSGTPIAAKFSENEPPKDGSRACACTKETSGCSIHPTTQEAWIASMRASLASLLATPEAVKALSTSAENCSRKSFASWMQSDPNTSFSKTFQDSSQADPRLAYAAGLIDGEGCIRIQRQSKKDTFTPVVQISMTVKARAVLLAMQTEFGGQIYSQDFKQDKWAKQLMWRMNGGGAASFLRKVAPLLMLKRDQAELAIALENMRSSQGWTEQTRKTAMRMKEQMHALNQKGPDARAAGEGWYQPTPDLFGTWNRFSGPWPRAGMTAAGHAYELPTWARPTSGTDGGVWLGTPTASMSERSEEFGKGRLPSPMEAARQQMFATPTNTANQLSPSMLKHPGCAAMWPTPTANEDVGGTPNGKMQAMLGNHPDVRNAGIGTLNPLWVEWLMGFPIGHTGLKRSEMPKSRFKRRSRGASSPEAPDA